MKIRINWEKVGAYSFGGLLGAGLSALGWHMLEKHGTDPGMFFRKKIVHGNISYYDPEKDPELADLAGEPEEEDIPDDEEDEDEDYGDDETDGGTAPVQAEESNTVIYRIDAETWYRSEDDEDYRHAEMKYWIDDQQVTDENGVIIPKPWLLIGGDNYDALADENGEREMFVRNEEEETDYCITRMEGSVE